MGPLISSMVGGVAAAAAGRVFDQWSKRPRTPMKEQTEKLLIAGILVTGAIALFSKSAGAAPAAASNGRTFDPGLGLPRVQTHARFKTASLSKPVDEYEWGQAARVLLASDDPSSFVAFVPASVGSVQTILARGPGPMTAELVAFVTRPVSANA